MKDENETRTVSTRDEMGLNIYYNKILGKDLAQSQERQRESNIHSLLSPCLDMNINAGDLVRSQEFRSILQALPLRIHYLLLEIDN